MKKWLGVVVLLAVSPLHAGYIEGQSGAMVDGPQSIYGARFGTEMGGWDGSVGYWGTRYASISGRDLMSDTMDLDTLDMELYRIVPLGEALSLRLGGGVGFTRIDLSGPSDADNNVSFVAGGSLNYKINENWSFGAFAKSYFFKTDTHTTHTSSHMETLSTGDEVEIEDKTVVDNSVNFNSILTGISIRYSF